MSSSLLLKLFPPPAFLVMPHAGLDISDDAITCVEYRRTPKGLVISRYATQEMPAGLLDGGDIKDEKQFINTLGSFVKKYGLYYVKVSLPEEKAYLFQTEVPSANFASIAQNIEFKLDQNVPLSAADALFQFDLMPRAVTGDLLRASVSVVPRTFVENYIGILRAAGTSPVAFEVVPKSIVAASIQQYAPGTQLIVHVMKKKTGLYIVSEGVVCFTSTVSWGSDELAQTGLDSGQSTLTTEINKVYSYWVTRPDVHTGISELLVAGQRAEECAQMLRKGGGEAVSHVTLPDVWHNVFNLDSYIPPITREESYAYAIAAGLALS